MRQKIVGIYRAGYDLIELVLREGTGGDFYFVPEEDKNQIPRIKIGADEKEFYQVFANLQHEIYEFQMTRNNCRFTPSLDISNDYSAFIFVMTHTQFSDISAKASDFIDSCRNDLYDYWNEWQVESLKQSSEEDPFRNELLAIYGF